MMLITDLVATRGFSIQDSPTDGGNVGLFLALAGDVNGDGRADIMARGDQYAGVFLSPAERPQGTLYIEDLDGTNGFRVRPQGGGAALAGAGDINGDGLADMVFGQPSGGSSTLPPPPGRLYIVLGRTEFPAVFENPGGDSEFNNFDLITDVVGPFSGMEVTSFGDMNGDGLDEFAGRGGFATRDDGTGFGSLSFDPNGFRLFDFGSPEDGIYEGALAGAGDVDNDGFDDALIGFSTAEGTWPPPDVNYAWLVYGEAGLGGDISTFRTTLFTGFPAPVGNSMPELAGGGDFNNDGYADLFLGDAVVFGQADGFGAEFDIGDLDGSNGFRITTDGLVRSAAFGDVNNDGFSDLIIGTPDASPDGRAGAGSVFILYGRAGTWTPSVDIASLGGDAAFRIDGAAAGDNLGEAVDSGEDVDGDGYDDIVIGQNSSPQVAYVIYGAPSFSASQFFGTPGNDTVTGDADANELYGLGGDDILRGLGGSDLLNGGTGFDIASYAGGPGGVFVSLDTGLGQDNDAEGDQLTGIEGLVGTDHVDVLIGDENANSLAGGNGDDRLYGLDGDDLFSGGFGGDRMFGSLGIDTVSYAGNFGAVWVDLATGVGRWNYAEGDVIGNVENAIGTSFGDRLYGDFKANRLDGGNGNDDLQGRDGNDTLDGGFGGDMLNGGAGIDTADYAGEFGGVWIDLATGIGRWNSAEGDTLSLVENVIGTSFTDWLTGNALNNRLEGSQGDDRLVGNAGNDVLLGGFGADVLDGGANVDTADYSGNFGGVWINFLTGQGKWNSAEGDTLSGIEKVIGTSFADTFESNGVTNIFTGGLGNDTFVFRPGFSQDIITDFEGNGMAAGDTIRFRTGIFTGYDDMLAHASQQGADVRIQVDAANFLVLQDTQLAELHSSDFIFG